MVLACAMLVLAQYTEPPTICLRSISIRFGWRRLPFCSHALLHFSALAPHLSTSLPLCLDLALFPPVSLAKLPRQGHARTDGGYRYSPSWPMADPPAITIKK